MKTYSLCIVLLLCLAGCASKPPQAVSEGMDLRDRALMQYSANTDTVVDAILDGYTKAAYAQIDDYHAQDMKALAGAGDASGKVDAVKALAFIRESDNTRQARRNLIDIQVKKTRDTYAEAKKDLVISVKLNQVLRNYEEAGMDMSVATKAAEQIMQILKPATAK